MGHDDAAVHDRGCHLDRATDLNQEQVGEARSGDAPDLEGLSVVFHNEGPYRRRQGHRSDPLGRTTAAAGHILTLAAELLHGVWFSFTAMPDTRASQKMFVMPGIPLGFRVAMRPCYRCGLPDIPE